jgi:hypothetical protein
VGPGGGLGRCGAQRRCAVQAARMLLGQSCRAAAGSKPAGAVGESIGEWRGLGTHPPVAGWLQERRSHGFFRCGRAASRQAPPRHCLIGCRTSTASHGRHPPAPSGSPDWSPAGLAGCGRAELSDGRAEVRRGCEQPTLANGRRRSLYMWGAAGAVCRGRRMLRRLAHVGLLILWPAHPCRR